MPDHQNPKNIHGTAPLPVDNRQALLVHGLDSLGDAFDQMPNYIDHSIPRWIEFRDQHWRPLLQRLNTLCQLCGDLYPNANVTHRPHYIGLTDLLNKNLSDGYFHHDIRTLTSHFRTFKILFRTIPDPHVEQRLSTMINKLGLAVDRFEEDLWNAPQHQVSAPART